MAGLAGEVSGIREHLQLVKYEPKWSGDCKSPRPSPAGEVRPPNERSGRDPRTQGTPGRPGEVLRLEPAADRRSGGDLDAWDVPEDGGAAGGGPAAHPPGPAPGRKPAVHRAGEGHPDREG